MKKMNTLESTCLDLFLKLGNLTYYYANYPDKYRDQVIALSNELKISVEKINRTIQWSYDMARVSIRCALLPFNEKYPLNVSFTYYAPIMKDNPEKELDYLNK